MPLVIRRATQDDIARFSVMPNKPSARAWLGEIDGEIIGLGGLALIGGRWHAFLDLKPEARSHRIALMRLAQRIFQEARTDGIRFIYAEVDDDEPKAKAWLTRLGFELDPRSQHLYRWSSQDPWQN